MCTDPLKPALAPTAPETPRSRIHEMWHHQKDMEQTSSQSQTSDPESHMEMAEMEPVERPALDLSHYNIINEVWHYSSVDWGHKCECTPLRPRGHRLTSGRPLCGLQLPLQYLHRFENATRVCQTKPSRGKAAVDVASARR